MASSSCRSSTSPGGSRSVTGWPGSRARCGSGGGTCARAGVSRSSARDPGLELEGAMTMAATDTLPRTGGGADRLQLDGGGALHLPGILDPEMALDLGRQIREAIAELGWSVGGDGDEPVAGRQEGSEGWWDGYARIQALEAFHALTHHPRLLDVQRRLVDAPFVHARRIANLLYPNFAVPPHQDYPAVQGTVDVCTLWVPLVSLPPEAGVLRVLRRPDVIGMLPLRALPDAGAEIAVDLREAEWDSYPYRAGDVVVLHSLSVHEVTVN